MRDGFMQGARKRAVARPKLEANRFLSDVARMHFDYNHQLDQRANFAIAISGAVLAVFVNALLNQLFNKVGIGIIIGTALVAVLLALLTYITPNLLTRRKRITNVMFYKNFKGMSFAQYEQRLWEVVRDERELVREYAGNIYNVSFRSLWVKNLLVNTAMRILVIGILIGTVVIVLA